MLDPYKTIAVCKHDGKEVGRIPVTAPNAERYIREMVRLHSSIEVTYEPDPTGGLLAALHAKK